MTASIYGVFGASGFGREVMPVLRAQVQATDPGAECLFVDDAPPADRLNGHACLTFDTFSSHPAAHKFMTLAIANSQVREALASRCANQGITFIEVRAANVVQLDDVELGAGAILCPFVTLTSNVRIGKQFHANIYSYVAHDCVIGDFVTFAPGVMCNGNVVVEDHAYIGTGAVIKQGKPGEPLVIGKGAVVGMGAVVTKSVPPGVTVVGNPAKVFER